MLAFVDAQSHVVPSLCSYTHELLRGCNGSLSVLDKRSCFGIHPHHCVRGKFPQPESALWIFGYNNLPSGSCNKHLDRYPIGVTTSVPQSLYDIFDKPIVNAKWQVP